MRVVYADESGDQEEVTVSGATRLDWTFALSKQSRVDPLEEWLRGYDSTQQRYELFAQPKPRDRKRGHPVVLFISAGDAPAGWSQLAAICKQQGMLFASPYDAGNNTRRCRVECGSCSMTSAAIIRSIRIALGICLWLVAMTASRLEVDGRGGVRTRTPLSWNRILSPMRLPVSPLGRSGGRGGMLMLERAIFHAVSFRTDDCRLGVMLKSCIAAYLAECR